MPTYNNITYSEPLSISEEVKPYLVNGMAVQVIATHKDGKEKIRDIRVALTQKKYQQLRKKCRQKHISKFESITPLDVENEYADFNKTLDEIEQAQNPSEQTKKDYYFISRFYQFRWNFWDITKLRFIQKFMHKAKTGLLDASIDLHALRNNPRSLLRRDDNIESSNINELILIRLKDNINKFKDRISTHITIDWGVSDPGQLEKVKKIQLSVKKECENFEEKIQTLIDNGAIEKDIETLFKNKHLGYFISRCEFILIDGLDKIIRDMDNNAYWDLWDLHPARKVFSRVKRKMEARASLEGAQTIADRPISEEMIESLQVTEERSHGNSDGEKTFWVSISSYVDREFSLPDIEDVLNVLSEEHEEDSEDTHIVIYGTPNKKNVNNEHAIKSPTVKWTAAILFFSFVWEPVPIIARFAVSIALIAPAILSILIEKGLNALKLESVANAVASGRKQFIEGAHLGFGRFCEWLSITTRLKKKRGEESLKRNTNADDALSLNFIDSHNINVPEEQRREAFLKRVNVPVNQMHVLAEKYFSPSAWGKNVTEALTSVFATPVRLGREFWENRSSAEKAQDVYQRIINQTDENIYKELEKKLKEWGNPTINHTSLASSTIPSITANKKKVATLETFCNNIEHMAVAATPNQTTDVQSFSKVAHEVIRVLADELVNSFLCESPGVTTAGAAAAISTLGLSLVPSIVSSLKLATLLHNAQILPDFLGKNIMGQGLSEGEVAKVFAAFLEYKAIAISGDAFKAVINGDLGIFKKIFHNPERLAFGFLCCTAVGIALSNIPGTVSLSLWEEATGMEEVQGPYIFIINFFLDEARHARRATLGANLVPYSFLGLKSLMVLKSLTEGKKERRHYETVVGKFFAAWRNNETKTLEEMLATKEGAKFLEFWDKFVKQPKENLIDSVNQFELKLKTARVALEKSEFQEINLSNSTSAVDLHSEKNETEVQKAYRELMTALNWIESRGDCLTFDKKIMFFNSDPYKFYDHLHGLFEKYNDLADFDAKIDGKLFLKDFYSKYCYEGSNNLVRSAIWLGNGLLLTPLYRRIKYALLSDSPAMREQFERSRAKDIYLAGEFVATTGRVLQAVLRLTDQFIIGIVGAVPFVVGGLIVGIEKAARAIAGRSAVDGQTRSAKILKAGFNWLCDHIKLHYIASTRESAYMETANTAMTTHNLPGTLAGVKQRAIKVRTSVYNTVASNDPQNSDIAVKQSLISATNKLKGAKKIKVRENLERLTQLQKKPLQPLENDAQTRGETSIPINSSAFGIFKKKEIITRKEKELQALPPVIREVAKTHFTQKAG